MKKILLLGDSIRLNYQAATTELFRDKAEILAPTDNCRDASYTLLSLATWLAPCPKPDVIQWNNGIWDITFFNGETTPFASLDDYLRDVKRTVKALRATGATLVFALTTPIDKKRAPKNTDANDVVKYNDAVRQMLTSEGVIINDLYSVVMADMDRYLCADGYHLSEEGKLACAAANYKIIAPLIERKEVLLLGDSIRQNYQETVINILGAKARVSYPADNCRWAGYTLNTLRNWLVTYPSPDIIHWNNGLWDIVSFYEEEGPFTPLPEYLNNLKRIIRVLKKNTHAKIIFALTTPKRNDEITKRVIEYNAAVISLMEEEGIVVNDLFSPIYANLDANICDDLTHLSEAGKAVAGAAVAKAIEKMLD